MKKTFFALIFLLAAFGLFCEDALKSWNPQEISSVPAVKINPESKYEQHRTCSFSKVLYKTKISPRNGVIYTDVNFKISTDSGIVVYQNKINSAVQNQFELFLTKDSLYQLEIPEFVWDGTFYNADSRAKENRRFEGAVNGNYVPDGVYSLLVELINSRENNENGGIVGADTQKYTIIVDKSAPKFNIALKTVCDDFARSKYSFLIYSEKNENLKGKTENNDETAVLWQIFYLSKSSGNENPEMIHVQGNEEALLSGDFDASKKGRLLPYQFSALPGDEITVVAYDEIGNCQKIKTKIPDKAIPSGNFLSAHDKFSFQNAAVRAVFEHLDGKTFSKEEKIEFLTENTDTAEILKTYSQIYKANLVLIPKNSNPPEKSENLQIPLKIDSTTGKISFTFPSDIKKDDSYKVYVSMENIPLQYACSAFLLGIFPNVEFYIKNYSTDFEENRLNAKAEFAFSSFLEKENSVGWKVIVKNEKGDKSETIASNENFSLGENYAGIFDSSKSGISDAGILTAELLFDNGVSKTLSFPNGLELRKHSDENSYLNIPDILFPAGRENFVGDKDFYEKNWESLHSIVKIWQMFKEKIEKIKIHAFANPTSDFRNPKILAAENEDELIPLSLQRAECVAEILHLSGIPKDKIQAIGEGGLEWIASPDNKEKNFLNRRCSFSISWKNEIQGEDDSENNFEEVLYDDFSKSEPQKEKLN